MFATDFLFNSQRLSDLGCIICSFDGELASAEGSEIEFNVVQSPNKDKFDFYGAKWSSQIVWNFSICKNTCTNDDIYFNQYEESQLAKWLLKTDGFKYFQFDQEGYEDIFYKVYINMLPYQVGGKTVGFDLTVTSDCAYGYTDLITKKAIINSTTPLKINVNNDVSTAILPFVTINGNGSFYLNNSSDTRQNVNIDKASEFKNVSSTVMMDSENDIIQGVLPKEFNWYFLRLVDGNNIITTNSESDIQLEIKYREARRVLV